ncbi:hypothetical protein GCM10010254_22560 [Streptomyces chromofuscus]|nr:hypothetical protein GCM10010254_22560 [Streptomyces chromofuscus]
MCVCALSWALCRVNVHVVNDDLPDAWDDLPPAQPFPPIGYADLDLADPTPAAYGRNTATASASGGAVSATANVAMHGRPRSGSGPQRFGAARMLPVGMFHTIRGNRRV